MKRRHITAVLFWSLLGLSLFHWGMACSSLMFEGCSIPWFEFAFIASMTTFTTVFLLKGQS